MDRRDKRGEDVGAGLDGAHQSTAILGTWSEPECRLKAG
jgi:hypothetical protein